MHCTLCNSTTREIVHPKEGSRYHICDACEFIWIDVQHLLSSADEKARYELHNNTLDNEGYVGMFETFISKTVSAYCAHGDSLLDFGCGTNPVLATLLQRHGFHVDHYDPYFFPELVYTGKQYDCITSTEVFEHIADPHTTMELFSTLLKPEGIIALMTLFHPEGDDACMAWWYRKDPTHIAFYTEKTIAHLASCYAMEVIYSDQYNSCVLQKVGM